jgi:hypothetical protein
MPLVVLECSLSQAVSQRHEGMTTGIAASDLILIRGTAQPFTTTEEIITAIEQVITTTSNPERSLHGNNLFVGRGFVQRHSVNDSLRK